MKTEIMLTREQCRAGRAMLDWSRGDLAKACGLSERTITDFERGARDPHANNLAAIVRAFEIAGLEFIPENGGGAGIRFRERRGSEGPTMVAVPMVPRSRPSPLRSEAARQEMKEATSDEDDER